MNTTELLDYISARTTIVVQPTNRKEKYPGIVEYTVGILKKTGPGFAQINNLSFLVLNEGVVAGPQVDENGDPVLDASGNQIVIAPEDAEQAWIPGEPPADPVFRDQAVTWLEANLPSVIKYFEIQSVDEDQKVAFVRAIKSISGVTSWTDIFVWVEGGTVSYAEITEPA
jgi:hypothetical protein